ncbi:MAG: prolyl oligopeptidase family serine peptidase [Marinilabiliaceae bacterium]|nr:prolyl oligopeptidase family serine peptidase [Marinilabiliaceae bacterium]
MRTTLVISLFFTICSVSGQKQPPQAKQIEYADTLHGVVIPDPYKWMEDIHSKEVLKYINAENKYTKQAIKKTNKLKEEFYKEVSQRKITSFPPQEIFEKPEGDYIYYTRSEGNNSLHCRRMRGISDGEEILFRVNKDFELFYYKPSPNQQKIAYTIYNELSGEMITYTKELNKSNANLTEYINSYFLSWVNDSLIVYAQEDDDSAICGKIYIHKLDMPISEDKLLYEQLDKSFEAKLNISNSKKYIFLEFFNNDGSEVHFIDVVDPYALKLFAPYKKGVHYRVYHDKNDTLFYISTNLDAPNFKIVTTSLNNTDCKNWVDFLPESDNIIQWVHSADGNWLILSEYSEGSMKLTILDKLTGNRTPINFDEKIYNVSFMHIDTLKKSIRFKYNSFITPDIYYDYDIERQQLIQLFETKVSNYNKSDYAVDFVYATALDGTKIPVTIIYNINTPRDGTAPLQMDVYGSAGNIDNMPIFRPTYLTLLDRGFYWVKTEIRGTGGAHSQRHKDGSGINSKNKAHDMASVAQYLINEKYTAQKKIYTMGHSGAGIALGTVANMYPELFGGIISIVPLLDVVFVDKNFNTAENLWSETGNPKLKEEFNYVIDYSPYQNVKQQSFPAMLFVTGLNDRNVPSYQTIKMVAKIRANNTNNAPIYLSVDLKGNHYVQNYKKILLPSVFILALHYNIL